ncbi:hypothetical protein GPA22_11675 [Aromatoleum toluvorans]|uniref:Uncharacterized protein n=1 Tax=Aromatoleum toluvorans TaxID=92002 RepID=A0ABX1PY66_9RHOO|nr:hypothetical protein [Aromatoleum toluvorans]NMG44386.1 hypothetical protein [Aromatoleum toluvorans]
MAFISGPVPECFEREVTASPAEFARDLRKASTVEVETVAPGHFRLRGGATRLDIHVAAGGVRRIGLLELPTLSVRYEFSGGSEADRRALLLPLDRAMQRGGG